jgi:bifunctional DNase/RNase
MGAVKTRLHKARAALQDRLSDLRREPTAVTTAVPMRIAEVRETPADLHIVLLEEVDGVRRVPIWIPIAEAAALNARLAGAERERPGTYRFTADLLAAAGTNLQEVRVVRLAESIFYAEAVLADGARVDARPSDALNLALETGAPVLAEDAVVAAAAMSEAQIAEEIAQSLERR